MERQKLEEESTYDHVVRRARFLKNLWGTVTPALLQRKYGVLKEDAQCICDLVNNEERTLVEVSQ